MATILAILLAAFPPAQVDASVVDDLAHKCGLTTAQFKSLSKECEGQRRHAISQVSSMIAGAKSKGRKKNKDLIDQLTVKKKQLTDRQLFAFAPMPQVLRLGAVGTLFRVKIQQVIGPDSARGEVNFSDFRVTGYAPVGNGGFTPTMTPGHVNGTDIILRGVPTKGFTDNRDAFLGQDTPFRVAGTETYQTVGGGTSTVFVVTPFDYAPLVEYAQLLYGKSTQPSRKLMAKSASPVPAVAAVINGASKTVANNSPSEPLPTRYVNETYNGTFRRVNNDKWEGIDNKTGKVGGYYDEISRAKDCVELLQLDRKLPTRLYADHIEQKLNGKWERVANGHWEAQSK